MPTNNNNKTDKKHRDEQKNKKRMSELAAYAKKRKIPKPPPPGKHKDPVKERLNNLRKSNSLLALYGGIKDTVNAVKNRNNKG